MRPAIVYPDDLEEFGDICFCVGIRKGATHVGGYRLVEDLNAGSLARTVLVRIKFSKRSIVHVVKRKPFSALERSLVVQSVLKP